MGTVFTNLLHRIHDKIQDLNIRLVPVDIRFPSTLEDEILTVETCLRQLEKSDLVIGLIGNRNGSSPKALFHGVYPPKGLEFLKNFEAGISYTEVEMRAAVLWKKPFFVLNRVGFRDETETPDKFELVQKLKTHLEDKFKSGEVAYFANFRANIQKTFLAGFSKFLESELGKLDDPKPLNKYKKPNEIIGRKLLVNKCRDIVYAGEMTALRGKKQCGKTLFLRFLYDLEKIKGRRQGSAQPICGLSFVSVSENKPLTKIYAWVLEQLAIEYFFLTLV